MKRNHQGVVGRHRLFLSRLVGVGRGTSMDDDLSSPLYFLPLLLMPMGDGWGSLLLLLVSLSPSPLPSHSSNKTKKTMVLLNSKILKMALGLFGGPHSLI